MRFVGCNPKTEEECQAEEAIFYAWDPRSIYLGSLELELFAEQPQYKPNLLVPQTPLLPISAVRGRAADRNRMDAANEFLALWLLS